MLFDDGGESDDSPLNAPASEDLEALLDGDELFPERFGLPGRGELRQRITLNASVLAMGYQRFIELRRGALRRASRAGAATWR